MKKPTQESKQTLTEEDTIHQWIPYAIAGVVFTLALIVGILSKDILMVLGSGLPAVAVFLIVRMAFPLPGSCSDLQLKQVGPAFEAILGQD